MPSNLPLAMTGWYCEVLTQWRVLGEALHTHGLARDQFNNGSVTRLQILGVVLNLLARTTVDLLLQLIELAGNVSGVAIQHRCIASTDLARVVQDDDLVTNKYHVRKDHHNFPGFQQNNATAPPHVLLLIVVPFSISLNPTLSTLTNSCLVTVCTC